MTDSGHIYVGKSMNPLFRDGDRVLSRPAEYREIRRGDVICFVAASGIEVVHRVIGSGPAGLRTCGDNNDAPDATPVAENAPLRLVYAIDRGGRIVAVRGGGPGMRFFRRVRARRACRRALGVPARALLRKLPGWCFAGRIEALSLYRFRDAEFLFDGKRPVARRKPDGSWRLLSDLDRFRYRQSELERNFPPGQGAPQP